MQATVQNSDLFHVARGQTLQSLGIDVIFGQFQRSERYLRPGRTFVPTGWSQMAKYPGSQFTCAFTIPITAEDDNQFIVVDAGNQNPIDVRDMIEKIGDDHEDVGASNPADVSVEFAL